MSVVLRQAREADIDSLIMLLRELFSLESDFSYDELLQRRGLNLLLHTPGSCVVVAEIDGVTVGMCTAQLLVSTAEGGPAAMVEDMVVHHDMRGRGLGRKLLDRVTRWAQREGVTRLQLLADVDNKNALDFYGHCGWTSTRLTCLRNRIDNAMECTS